METILVTVAASAVVFLPLGAIYGRVVAAHASAEASAVKAHITAEVKSLKGDVSTALSEVAKKV